MKFTINETTVSFKIGDITQEPLEAIVNAANARLQGGGGVDGAIHRAGGPEIMKECRRIGNCPPGQAVLTTGGHLPARYVIHTVGPIYHGGRTGEEEILRQAYTNSLHLATQNNIRSLAFPSLSTGAYGYPIEKASKVALKTCLEYIKKHPGLAEIRFVLFSRKDYTAYVQSLQHLFPEIFSQARDEDQPGSSAEGTS